jgi:hypothetical protein
MPVDEELRARAKRRAEQRSASIWYRLKEGDNTFRILPTPATPVPAELREPGADKAKIAAFKRRRTPKTFIEYRQHRDVGPHKRMVGCGKDPVTDQGSCWLCDVQLPKLIAKGQSARAAAMEAKSVLALQVAAVSPEEEFSGPFIFTPSKKVGDQLLGSILASKKRDYKDPVNGYNLTINRTGTGKNDTRYGIIEADPEPSEVPKALMAKLKPFSELSEIPMYDEGKQKAAYIGAEVTEEEPGEEEVAVKPRRKAAQVDDDEEPSAEEVGEEEDLGEDDPDPEPAPAPAKRKSAPVTTKKQAPVEDDLDPELDADLDLEEAPAPKKKTAPAPAPTPKKKTAPVEDPEDDLGDDIGEDLDAEVEEATAPTPKKKTPPPVEDETDLDLPDAGLDDLDAELEAELAPPKKKAPPAKARR